MSEADIQGMGTLLSRMTADNAKEMRFTDNQVNALIEILIPRMVTTMPGLAAVGLKCQVSRDDKGWDIRIDRPSG